jgi:hypothetical protein
MDQDPSAELAQ